MGISEIRQLPVPEKVRMMEILWADWRGASETAPVPKAHRQLLDARRKAVKAGDEEMLDWDAVKNDLGSRADCGGGVPPFFELDVMRDLVLG